MPIFPDIKDYLARQKIASLLNCDAMKHGGPENETAAVPSSRRESMLQ